METRYKFKPTFLSIQQVVNLSGTTRTIKLFLINTSIWLLENSVLAILIIFFQPQELWTQNRNN